VTEGSVARPRAWLAAILALVAPGLGHLYAGRARRAFGVVAIVLAARVVFGVVFTASGGRLAVNLAAVALMLGVAVSIVVDAARCAREGVHPVMPSFQRLSRYVLWGVVATGAVELERAWIRDGWYETYRMPSEHLAPVLLPGDHFTVDKRAYRSADPQPGEIVLVDDPEGLRAERVGADRIPREEIVGRVAFIHFSVEPGSRTPRWDRLGSGGLRSD